MNWPGIFGCIYMVTKMLNAKKLPFGVSISYIDRNSANRDSKTILNNRYLWEITSSNCAVSFSLPSSVVTLFIPCA